MVADVKHFAANNQETLRQGINEHITVTAIIADCMETTLKSERKNEILKTFREETLYNKIYYEETGERGIIICGQS